MKKMIMAALAVCVLALVSGCKKEETPAEKVNGALDKLSQAVEKAAADTTKAVENATK